MIRFVVLVGEEVRGASVPGDRCTVGSSERCGVRVRAPEVSHLHLLVRPLGKGFEFVNVGPAGTVRHRGVLVDRGLLAEGDRLEVGGARLMVRSLERTDAGGPGGRVVVPGTGRGLREIPFEEALYRALRRSPPWVVSAFVHFAAALFLLEVSAVPPRGAPPAEAGVRGVPVAGSLPGLDEEVEAAVPGTGPEPPRLPDSLPPPPLPLRLLPSEGAEESDGEDGGEGDDPLRRGTDLSAIGIEWEGGGRAAGARFPRRAARNREEEPAAAPFPADRRFESGGASGANLEAAGRVRREAEGNPADAARLRNAGEARILVLPGAYDAAEDVLALLRIRHTLVTGEELENLALLPGSLLVVDCGNRMISARAAARVREFVEAGGYLCTTDWGATTVLAPAFPGVLEVLEVLEDPGGAAPPVSPTVAIRLPHPDDPLVWGVARAGGEPRWWLEERSSLFAVRRPKEVRVLVEAPELRAEGGVGALAVVFRHGRGEVLHLAGHLFQKEGNLGGTYAVHRIFVNFLLRRVLAEDGGVPPTNAAGPGGR